MGWGRRPRYCCTNVRAGCRHALEDRLFSQAQFKQWGGVCRGNAVAAGCGNPLLPGRPEDRRLPWLAAGTGLAAALVGVSWMLRTWVFPPPLQHISFAGSRTTVVDTAGQASVALRRSDGASAAARLQARFVDGSARAGEDYLASASTIELPAGQQQVVIQIPVLRDGSFRKRERHFSVVLENVDGKPTHTVVITPPTTEPGGRVVIEQSVLSASRVAADVAALVVKVEAMERLMSAYRGDAEKFKEARMQHRSAADNLTRAREAYLRAMQDLRAQPPQEVLSMVDRLAGELRERRLKQQADVLPVVGRHLQELLGNKSPDMDRWIAEIGATVPRVPGWNAAAPRI